MVLSDEIIFDVDILEFVEFGVKTDGLIFALKVDIFCEARKAVDVVLFGVSWFVIERRRY